MSDVTNADRIWSALAGVIDPELRRPLTELGMIERVDERPDGSFEVELRLTIVGCPAARQIEREVRAAIESVIDVARYELEIGVMTREQRTALTERLRGSRAGRVHPFGRDSLTRVIAVTSGKGGVGKSTVTANLAAAFARRGLSVGLIDADVHGYSIPGLFGLGHDVAPTRIGDMIVPPESHGVKLISIGMFLGDDAQVVAWRGPMLHRTIEQFLTDVYFGDLDVLLLDLPPGTGDIAISLGQLLPNAEVVVVTTPQAAAADVAWRSGALARKTGQRVVGVIETMSPFASPDGGQVALFGEGGGRAVAERLSAEGDAVALLAEVPVSQTLRESGDAGTPLLRAEPTEPAGQELQRAADALLAQPRGLSGRRLPVSLV
ncbi:Mrp/NBP35 family ATP-binding protein [Pseudoclavibacter sp. RFBG4]|uniref:Mrp/NBP35 family ATP-binding protein n=1 Tax=Pseudoclavibacter sp. RFBG4 TaxID=2080575 RepID=UPI00268E9D6F